MKVMRKVPEPYDSLTQKDHIMPKVDKSETLSLRVIEKVHFTSSQMEITYKEVKFGTYK